MSGLTENKKTVHYAPTQTRLRQKNPMCGYVGPEDDISMEVSLCSCRDCPDWVVNPSVDIAAGVTGHD